ncbi:hypothetical protein IID19_05720, partial [Patescibacteria group bacterium]|nr:hypothetical protein [Patescibacteria group bacterium]
MFLKKFLITICVMALVVGCSNEQPTSPVVNNDIETINATTEDVQGDNDLLQQEAEAFGEALESGKYRFSVDENGDLTLYDGVNIPEGEDELYAEFLKLSQIPDSDKRALTSTASSSLSSYWRYAVWREVCYALSRTKYLQGQRGQSRRTYYYGNKWWLAGDWNYDGKGYGIGGTCKVFARRVVQRATGYRYNLPTGYRYAYGSIYWCKPGDIIQR